MSSSTLTPLARSVSHSLPPSLRIFLRLILLLLAVFALFTAFVPPAKGQITDTILKNSILMFGLDLPTFFPFFLGTLKFAYYFIPALQATQRLDNAFYVPTSDGKVDAFARMRDSLSDLSWSIQSRAEDDASEGLVPPFTTLDPVNLPFGSTI
jgi:hypothetical protein